MTEIATERVEIRVGQGSMGGYLAYPKGTAKAPGVLVFQEIFGVNSHIRSVTERVAKEGYVTLAPDYFWRTDPGVELNYDAEGRKRGVANLQKLQSEELLQDVEASLSFLRARPDVITDRIGCMGFCIGGHVAYLTACETDVAASVAFYGGGIATFRPGGGVPTVSLSTNIRGEILCLFGGKDAGIPKSQRDTIEKALSEAKIKHEIVVYPDAEHGFFCDQRATFHEPSRDAAWEKVKGFFSRVLQQNK